MTVVHYSSLADLQSQVCEGLVAAGLNAQGWHSGGGIFGTLITRPSGDCLFFTLDSDGGHEAWTGMDWWDREYDLIGTIEVQVRPYQSKWGPTGEVRDFVEAIANVARRIK